MGIRNGELRSPNMDWDGQIIFMLPDEVWSKVSVNNAGNPDVEEERPIRELEPNLSFGNRIAVRNYRQKATNIVRQIQAITRTPAAMTPEGSKQLRELEKELEFCCDAVKSIREEL